MINIDIQSLIRDYQDFPKPGVLFRDITPIFRNEHALKKIVNDFKLTYPPTEIEKVAGIESRGFILATALGFDYGKGLLLIRKAGKLPGETTTKEYSIEYGKAVMEIQKDAITNGERVLIADDLIATGGTALAAANLIESLGGKVVGFAFIIELKSLKGGDILRNKGYKVNSLVTYS